jgi:molecular chaperone DnaJ
LKDYYSILGLQPGATKEEIKSQFRKLAKEQHPDAGGNEEQFKELVEAYEALMKVKVTNEDFNPYNFRSKYETMLVVAIQVSLLDIINQKPVNLTYEYTRICDYCQGTGASKMTTCPTCQGRGFILFSQQGQFRVSQFCPTCGGRGVILEGKCPHCNGKGEFQDKDTLEFIVPPQMNSRESLKFNSKGNFFMPHLRGPLFVYIEIPPYNGIEKQGLNLISKEVISLIDYYKGRSKVKTINGMEEIELPKSKEPFFTIVRKGKGVNEHGDHVINCTITIPEKDELLKSFYGGNNELSNIS